MPPPRECLMPKSRPGGFGQFGMFSRFCVLGRSRILVDCTDAKVSTGALLNHTNKTQLISAESLKTRESTTHTLAHELVRAFGAAFSLSTCQTRPNLPMKRSASKLLRKDVTFVRALFLFCG